MKEEFKKYFWDIIKNHYADFKGRATRKEYWSFISAYIILVIIIGFFIDFFSALHLAILSGVFLGLFILFTLAVFVPSLALSIRRIHDMGQSGWWYLIALIPYAGSIVLVVFFCLPSEKGHNKWGPNPHDK